MSAKTYALRIGTIMQVAKMENGKVVKENGEPVMEDKFVPENVLTTRTGLKINEATLEPENISKTLQGKAFILFDVDEQKEVKSGTL